MITLTDLYLLYNKARGTELISPDDFWQAVQVTNSLNLGIIYRLFNSGVKVIQLNSFNSDEMCSKIVDIIINNNNYNNNGINAQMISEVLNISIIIAKEVLLIAESKEYLIASLDYIISSIRLLINFNF